MKMWIAKDSDDTIVLFQEKPVWNNEFSIWNSNKWEADITSFPELYRELDITTEEPKEVSVKIVFTQLLSLI